MNTELLQYIKSDIKFEDFPEELKYGQQNVVLNDFGETAAMAWLHYRHETPPEEYMGDMSKKNFYGFTAAMYWCEYTKEKELHPRMLHNKYITNNEGMPLSMVYMACREKLPPDELLCDPEFKDSRGRTQAMFYLQNIIGELPEKLFHDKYIADNNGNTLEFYYVLYDHRYNPRFEISNIYKNRKGDTLVMAAIQHFQGEVDYIPKHMYHDKDAVTNNDGRSYNDLKSMYC